MLEVAFSTCPNDTYLFHAWAKALVGKNMPINVHLADIEQLNIWALAGRFPLLKLSFACLKKVLPTYELLPVGAALGFSVGPKLVALEPKENIADLSIAIPGEETTAHLLLHKLLPTPKKKIFCRYDEIGKKIRSKEADAGVIIHESRFTYQQEGFVELIDLGKMWETKTQGPTPLGCLAVKRGLPKNIKTEIMQHVRASLLYAREHPQAAASYILEHAQGDNLGVVSSHIKLYVNKESEGLSPLGIHAIETLLDTPKEELGSLCA